MSKISNALTASQENPFGTKQNSNSTQQTLIEYSSNIFNIDLTELSNQNNANEIQEKIKYLRILLTELCKLQNTHIDFTKYSLSLENLKAIQKIYPSLVAITHMSLNPEYDPSEHPNSTLAKFNFHKLAEDCEFILNYDKLSFTTALQRLRSTTSSGSAAAQEKYNILLFDDISLNVLFGGDQGSISSGVIYCTAPASNMVCVHNNSTIYFMAAPNEHMKVFPNFNNALQLLNAEKSTQVYSGLKTLVGKAFESYTEAQLQLPIHALTLNSSATIAELEEVPYQFFSLSPLETLLLNQELFSAWPSAQYSHGHFCDSQHKFASSFCRGSNTFDGTLRSGISTTSQLASWLCDVSLFIESINVSDMYSTASTPTLVSANSDGQRTSVDSYAKDLATGYLGISYYASESWSMVTDIPYFRKDNNISQEYKSFQEELLLRLNNADKILADVTSLIIGQSTDTLPSLEGVNISDLRMNLYRREMLALEETTPDYSSSSNEEEHRTTVGANICSYLLENSSLIDNIGNRDYIYTLAQGTIDDSTYTSAASIAANHSSSSNVTQRLGLLLLATELGEHIHTYMDQVQDQDQVQVQDPDQDQDPHQDYILINGKDLSGLYMHIYVYRQTLHTYLLNAVFQGTNAPYQYSMNHPGLRKACCIATNDTYLNLHNLFSNNNSAYQDSDGSLLARTTASSVSVSSSVYYKGLYETVVSVASKGDKLFRQIEYLLNFVNP